MKWVQNHNCGIHYVSNIDRICSTVPLSICFPFDKSPQNVNSGKYTTTHILCTQVPPDTLEALVEQAALEELDPQETLIALMGQKVQEVRRPT